MSSPKLRVHAAQGRRKRPLAPPEKGFLPAAWALQFSLQLSIKPIV